MPEKSLITIEEEKADIRKVLAIKPKATIKDIAKTVGIDRNYASKLVDEVRTERLEAITQETKEELYAEISDLVYYINDSLRAIAEEEKLEYTKVGKDGEPIQTKIYAQQNRIKALNSIVDNTLKLVDKKMDLGILERRLGTVDTRIIDVMSALKKIRNGDHDTPLEHLIEGKLTDYLPGGSDEGSEENREGG